MVAHRQRLDAWAHFGHDPRAFMATDHREHRLHAEHLEDLGSRAHVAGAEVLVGVAHAGIGHLDPHLVRAGRRRPRSPRPSMARGAPCTDAARIFIAECLPLSCRQHRAAASCPSTAPGHRAGGHDGRSHVKPYDVRVLGPADPSRSRSWSNPVASSRRARSTSAGQVLGVVAWPNRRTRPWPRRGRRGPRSVGPGRPDPRRGARPRTRRPPGTTRRSARPNGPPGSGTELIRLIRIRARRARRRRTGWWPPLPGGARPSSARRRGLAQLLSRSRTSSTANSPQTMSRLDS